MPGHLAELTRGSTKTRACYICGCETQRRQIVEPWLVPTCLRRECRDRAEALPAQHCAFRLPKGALCGQPASQMQFRGVWMCAWHARQRDGQPAAA